MQIRTIPFHLPFLPVLARYIAQKHASISPDFSSILVVFPSERNKVYFREYLLQETGKGGIIPPYLFTIEQLYDHVFEKLGGRKADLPEKIERDVLLKEAVNSVRRYEKILRGAKSKLYGEKLESSNGVKVKNLKELPFIKFVSIGRKLLGFFDELASWDLTIEEVENVKEELHFPSQYIDEELPILK